MAGRLAARWAGRRRTALLALAAAVLAVHGWVTSAVADRMREVGSARDMPARVEVAYVRELLPTEPPVVAPAPLPPPTAVPTIRPRPPVPADAAASESASAPPPDATVPKDPPAAAEPASAPPWAEAASEPIREAHAASEPALLPAVLASAAAAAASAPASTSTSTSTVAVPEALANAAAPAGAASGAVPFEWPASTRLTYRLTGYFRGDVEGDAQVEWVRTGPRYQVHLDFSVGPSIAPLYTRRMTSDGEITATGLSPRRFDQDTKIVFRDRQRLTLLFDADGIVLANGERRPPLAGAQDMASQFVQLSYLFTTRPELLRSGNSIDMPLAFPRKVERWVYDVLAPQTLSTPVGELATFHLKPRREGGAVAGDLVMETWFAPSLRYLPVRIRIEQSAEVYFDLLLAKRPEVAAP